MNVFIRFFLFIAICSTLSACQQKETDVGVQKLKTGMLQIEHVRIHVEIADTAATMAKGLMFRDNLEADSGMLFVFEQPKQANFWMRNTKIPLSIAYLDATGCILEIHDMFPYDESAVSSYGTNVSFALEMNQGWFKKNNITPGMIVDGIPKK